MSIYLTCVGFGIRELLIAAWHEVEADEVFDLLLTLQPCILLLGTRALSTEGREVNITEGTTQVRVIALLIFLEALSHLKMWLFFVLSKRLWESAM